MEAFEIGTHVLIELEDTTGVGVGRKIAGFLHGANEEGLFIKATHKDVPALYMVSDELREDTRKKLKEATWLGLKLELLERRELPALLKGRAWVEEYLTALHLQELIEAKLEEKPFMFKELNVPVLTYVGAHRIALMEASDDVTDDYDVTVSAAGLDAELPDLLEGKIPPRQSDEKVLDEVDGTEEGKDAEQGSQG